MKGIIAILALAACSSKPSGDHQTFDGLDFFVPAGWGTQSKTFSDVYTQRIQYMPQDNVAKQSIVVVHSSPRETHANAGTAHVEKLLEAAQASLPRAKFSPPTRFRNDYRMVGLKIEGSFVPPGLTETYQRMHAVIFDDRSFIHVIYTAMTPDREAFETVIDSLSRRGV